MLFPQHSEATTWGCLYRYCSYFDLLLNQTSVNQINRYSKPRDNYSKITVLIWSYSLNKSWVWVLLLDIFIDRLEINPNKHAATIKTITLNTFKTVYFYSAACRSSFIQTEQRGVADNGSAHSQNVSSIIMENVWFLWHMSLLWEKYFVITRKDVLWEKYVVITRKYVILTRKDLL